jgi:rod shape determining protein RodA
MGKRTSNFLSPGVGVPYFLPPLGICLLSLLTLFFSLGGEERSFFFRQIFYDLLSFLFLFILLYLPPRRVEQLLPFLYGGVCLLLLFVLLAGKVGGGSKRWLSLGFFHIQPSELAKVVLLLFSAKILSKDLSPGPVRFSTIFFLFGLTLPLVVVVILQPDLGTAGMLLLSVVLLLLVRGVPFPFLLFSCLGGLLFAYSAWNFLLLPYQKKRILTFLDPMGDPTGSGYHILQSKIAIGSAGIFGKGFSYETVSGLQFLPEHHTDFIFGSFVELTGLLGGVVLLTLYGVILHSVFQFARKTEDLYVKLVSAGVGIYFLLHVGINTGMVLGLFPVVGIPLPWMSYGGSVTFSATFLYGYYGLLRKHQYPR